MAETGAHARENGVSHRKRREAMPGGESAPKKIKLEEDTPPEANPNTIEAVREKNKALEIDMREKNRRIAYLTKKCEALYRSRGVTSASFRCLRRQWFQLQDELLAAVKTVDPSAVSNKASKEAWQAALDTVDGFGQFKTRIAELERDIEAKETERHRACRDYDRLSAYVEQRGGVNTDNADVGEIKMENAADDDKTGDKTSSGLSSTEMVKQEALVEKEKEHAKTVATLRENMGILSKKLYQERHKVDTMKRELEKIKASETAWKNDEAAMIQDHDEKLKQLRDDKAHVDEEYKKLLHKTKDFEHHMTEKWEKKITKIQAEMSKTKSQMDELNLKNVSLREKISNASTYRDQV
ncbi:Centrosomal protein of 44 kDa [Phytophthora nicotianae]|uniref:E3 ubiquitin protein ligase n=1 Tax=Phytophthora nicotianae TaxID=4792 RepID=A0A0W8D3C9_PHYNI|nr:Centrosomal protein of 44 kDa [Phytophthora nicotianae]